MWSTVQNSVLDNHVSKLLNTVSGLSLTRLELITVLTFRWHEESFCNELNLACQIITKDFQSNTGYLFPGKKIKHTIWLTFLSARTNQVYCNEYDMITDWSHCCLDASPVLCLALSTRGTIQTVLPHCPGIDLL